MIGLHKNRCIFNEDAELLIGRDIQVHNLTPIHLILTKFVLKSYSHGTLPVIGVHINRCIFNEAAEL